MSNLEYGYIGSSPTQSRTGNSGVFSMDDIIDLEQNEKWRWGSFPVETASAQLDIYLDAMLGSYSTSSGAENLANTVYGTSTLGNFAQSGGVGHSTTEANYFGAFTFDGSNDYLYKSYSSVYSGWREGMTISIWLNRDDYNGRQNVWNNGYGGLGTITLETGGGANFYHGTHGDNSSPYQGSGGGFTLSLGEVSNITVCRRSATVQWYKNGVQTSSKTNSHHPAANGSNELRIGLGYAGYYDGKIYTVQCWDGELTDAEILQNYQYFAPRFGMS